MPEEYRSGAETLSYSYRLNTAYAPRDYTKDLRAISQPQLVIAGTSDEAFFADRYKPIVSRYTHATVSLLKDVTHMGVVVGTDVQPIIENWLEGLSP